VQTDAGYFQQPAAPPSPADRYRPMLEELAKAGSPRACVWFVSNIWHTSPDVVALKSRCLDVITAAELDADLARRFGWGIELLVRQLGAATVEPKVLALAERVADETRVSLLFSLAVALCETARDDAQRERGIALLRQVVERWPDGDYAKGAEGKLFRYTKLLVGQPAPDFEATDVDGNAFRLSDYAGKVTVIDFWGFW
jgi:hypothetical protein